MKINVKSYLWLVFAGMIGLSSCKEDEETPVPTITIVSATNTTGTNPTGGNSTPGNTINFTLRASASEKIDQISATEQIGTTGGGSLTGYPITDFDSPTSHEWTLDYVVPQFTSTITLKFTVKDKNGKEAFKTFTISKTPDFESFSGKLLFAPLKNYTTKSFISLTTGATYDSTQAASNISSIDMGYFWGITANASFASPSDYLSTAYNLNNWTNPNVTTFKSTSNVDFATISSSNAIGTAYDNGTLATNGTNPNGGATRIYLLTSGQVVGFQTASGKKGLIKITNISDGATGSITFDVKVQK
jgi:hypothetical protein